MSADRCTLRIQREDSEELELDGLGLARAFFAADAGPTRGQPPAASAARISPGRVGSFERPEILVPAGRTTRTCRADASAAREA
jgi:hypothetical protein